MTIDIPWIELNNVRSNIETAAAMNRFAWPSITIYNTSPLGYFIGPTYLRYASDSMP